MPLLSPQYSTKAARRRAMLRYPSLLSLPFLFRANLSEGKKATAYAYHFVIFAHSQFVEIIGPCVHARDFKRRYCFPFYYYICTSQQRGNDFALFLADMGLFIISRYRKVLFPGHAGAVPHFLWLAYSATHT